MWSDHVLDGWSRRLNLSMFLFVISVGRNWSVHSVLEFSAMKRNLRIISDIERVFCTVLLRMASRMFLFLTYFLHRVTPVLSETGLCGGSLVIPL